MRGRSATSEENCFGGTFAENRSLFYGAEHGDVNGGYVDNENGDLDNERGRCSPLQREKRRMYLQPRRREGVVN